MSNVADMCTYICIRTERSTVDKRHTASLFLFRAYAASFTSIRQPDYDGLEWMAIAGPYTCPYWISIIFPTAFVSRMSQTVSMRCDLISMIYIPTPKLKFHSFCRYRYNARLSVARAVANIFGNLCDRFADLTTSGCIGLFPRTFGCGTFSG